MRSTIMDFSSSQSLVSYPTTMTRVDRKSNEGSISLNTNYNNRLLLRTQGFGLSGQILTRTSRKLVFFRRWDTSYWLHVFPTVVLFFRSENDLRMWKDLNNNIDINSIQSLLQNWKTDELIKWAIDFDTLGVVRKQIHKSEKRTGNRKSDFGEIYQPKNYEEKSLYFMREVQTKKYRQYRSMIHCFKVEKWASSGCEASATFASDDSKKLKAIRDVFRACLQITRKNKRFKTRDKVKSPQSVAVLSEDDQSQFTNISVNTNRTGTRSTLYSCHGKRRRIHRVKLDEDILL
mmetsp:Transcript_25/g.29  ORF Transcript_25/g.29 Transcript_25/m.29 type:complete len:290 (-) Transcript_25:32-901(-)